MRIRTVASGSKARLASALAVLITIAMLAGSGPEMTAASSSGEPIDFDAVLAEAKNLSAAEGVSANPEVASDPVGNMAVAWEDFTTGDREIFVSVSRDFGANWSAAINASNSPDVADASPVPWVNETGVGVYWVGLTHAGNLGDLTYSFMPYGGAFQIPQIVRPDDVVMGSARLTEVDVNDPNAPQLIEWLVENNLPYYVVGDSEGNPATDPKPQAFAPTGVPVPDLDGNAWNVQLKDNGEIEVWQGHVNDQGDDYVWTLNQTIQAGARDAWIAPGDNSDQSDSIIVYWETKVPPIKVRKSVYDVISGHWNEPEQVSDETSASGPVVGSSGQFQFWGWIQINAGTGKSQLVGKVSTDGGHTLGESFVISPDDQNASDAQVAVADDLVVILYSEFILSEEYIHLAALNTTEPGLPPEPILDQVASSYAQVFLSDSPTPFAHAQGGQPSPPNTHVSLLFTDPPEDQFLDDIWVAPIGHAGDGNCDGITDELDALALAASEAGLPGGACDGLLDVDCSGDADVDDLLAILEGTAGFEPQIPADCPTIER